MDGDFAVRNWALLLAASLAGVVCLFVVYHLYRHSVQARLGAAVARLQAGERRAKAAARSLAKAASHLQKLQARAASVRPRRLEEASEAVEDARLACEHADDRLLVARNELRKTIVEEYPPKRHAVLRRRYLREQDPET